jgi:O-antigen ligase
MLNRAIESMLMLLIILTPIAGGSVAVPAFSAMEIGILVVVLLWSMGELKDRRSSLHPLPKGALLLGGLFLGLVLVQMIRLPEKLIEVVSPRTFELRHQLQIDREPSAMISLSFFPFGTKIEFIKWMTLIGFFLFFFHWRHSGHGLRGIQRLLLVVLFTGVFEASYGFFRFFGLQNHLLNPEEGGAISSATGTFVNRNHFAGYLLMAIPASIGLLFSCGPDKLRTGKTILHRIASLDGRTLLLGFGIVVMILGLIFSASRMGILSLLFSFGLMTIFFRGGHGEKRLSTPTVLILGLAVLWAAWIGLDAVISRFVGTSEDLRGRWMIWVDTFRIFRDFPLFGSGLGTFEQAFPMYRSFHIRGTVTHAENDFLQLASEVGLVGSLLLLGLFVTLFVKAVSRVRSLSSTHPERRIAIGGLVGILAIMFHSLVERNLQVPANAFLYCLLWGIVMKLSTIKIKKEQQENAHDTKRTI